MANAIKSALSASAKYLSGCSHKLSVIPKQAKVSPSQCLSILSGKTCVVPRTHCTLSAISKRSTKNCGLLSCYSASSTQSLLYSTEVDKEICKFLEKEIEYETSKATKELPKVAGFDVKTDGGDVTLTKSSGSEKVVVRLSVNGAVDSIMSESVQSKPDEPPQMVCRPPFEVEISKGDGSVLAFQCTFTSLDEGLEEGDQYAKGEQEEQIDDQFELQEVALHGGEWKDSTFSVSAATMDAELFDLLMDMLDERGINDDFISNLVDFCTTYENSQYIGFLKNLKGFSEK